MNTHIFPDKENKEGLVTSGAHISYWTDSTDPITFERLQNDISTETVVIGGGISGITVAYCLAKAGRPVVVIEDGFLGSGETGRTTAHIVNALDDRYSEIESRLGEETSRLAAESHTSAIEFIADTVKSLNIDCEFERIDGYLFLHPSDNIKTINDEYEATQRAGIQTRLVSTVPGISLEKGPCLLFPNQAQFHPMKYIRGLAEEIVRLGGKIYTETHATKMEATQVIANDYRIVCKHVVVATNSPVNDLVTMHTKQHPYRTYVIGALVPKNSLKRALWWDTGNMSSKWVVDPYHYVRLTRYDDQYDLLISGGEDHKTGQTNDEDIPEENRFEKLIAWTREKFPAAGEIVYQWSGQVLEPVDSLAFIGRNPGDEHIFIATGDSGNGMTHGTIAGMLISDLIIGRENPWEKIYQPSRITLRATGDFVKEVGNMTAQYLDYLSSGDIKTLNELGPGQGAIMSMGVKKVAVYRDEHQELHAYSAVCPHLGCVVRWNGAEKSFDCPCHGSRFTCEGKVVNGPAMGDLKPHDLNETPE